MVESCSHEGKQRRGWNQGHYLSLREFNYIFIFKKSFVIYWRGRTRASWSWVLADNLLRKGCEREKGTFSGTVRSAIAFLHLSVSADPTPGPQRKSWRSSKPRKSATQELKELEVGRINQIGCGAPSVRWVCGTGDKGDGYTRADDEKTERGSMSTLELKELDEQRKS